MATAEANIQNKILKDKEDSENYQEILDENVSVKREDIKAEQIKLSSEEDLESLLKLAEDSKEKIDNISGWVVRIKFLQFVFVLSFFIYLFVGFYFTKESVNTERQTSRKEDIKSYQQTLMQMSAKRDDLTRELKLSSDLSGYKSSDKVVQEAIKKRIDDIEASIKSTETSIDTLIKSPIKEFSFIEFLSIPEKFVPGLIVLAMVLFVSAYFISKYKQKLPSEKTSLSEVLQLLREVHGTIAEREDWSILKRAEFRIRLSRFDLSEKKESVFNFFS